MKAPLGTHWGEKWYMDERNNKHSWKWESR